MRAYLILVPALFALSVFGPGFLIVRRLDWSAGEKITASIALSLLVLHLACFGIFVLGLPRAAHLAILAACALATLAGWREAKHLLGSEEARRLLGGFGLLAIWVVALLALVRGYSGGIWYGDWHEHYRRSLFFLGGHDPAETFQGYALPARPPLVNVLAAHLLALAGDRFRVYQLAASLLGLLAYFPVCLAARLASRSGRVACGVVAAFLMFNPLFVQNATYCWTKLPAAFFVLCGVCFYVAGHRLKDPRRTLMGFAALGAGVLAHYSAAPAALFLALHYLGATLRARPIRWREIAAIAGCGGLLVGSWLAWSAWTYGARATLASTSSVRDRSGLTPGENLRIASRNLRDTLVPHPLRRTGPGRPDAALTWGALRDTTFNNYQQTLPLGLGLLGSVLLLYEIARSRRGAPGGSRAGPGFWAGFVAFNVLAGVAAHAREAPLGLAHVALQPIVLLGIAFLAARFADWPPRVRWAAIAGLAADVLFGVVLHVWFLSLPLGDAGGASGLFGLSPADLRLGDAVGNWRLQQSQATVFVGTDLRSWAWFARLVAAAALAAGFGLLVRGACYGRMPPRRHMASRLQGPGPAAAR